jgi:hypothetical protein
MPIKSSIQLHPRLVHKLRPGSRYLPKRVSDCCEALASCGHGFVCHTSDFLEPAYLAQSMPDFEQILLHQLPRGFTVLESAENVDKAMALAKERHLVHFTMLHALICVSDRFERLATLQLAADPVCL